MCLIVYCLNDLCSTARRYTRAYLHLLLKSDSIGPQLITYHNIAYMMSLTRGMRNAIIDGMYGVLFKVIYVFVCVRVLIVNHACVCAATLSSYGRTSV